MLIQLRQSEIEAALKKYIQDQGISLYGKTVDISFTSGRKDNGVSADLDINECVVEKELYLNVSSEGHIKGFGSGTMDAPSQPPKELLTDTGSKDPEEATDASDFEEDAPEPVAEVPVKTAASLFN